MKCSLGKDLIKILGCPTCKGSLKESKNKNSLLCPKCNKKYPIKDGIPILMP